VLYPYPLQGRVYILAGLLRSLHKHHNAHGHRVVRMVADAEPALKPVVGMLAAAAGILLTLVDHGQHIQRAERTIQSLTQRKRAVLAGFPFFLPLKYASYAERWVCNVMNGLPNFRRRPSTSDILFTGRERAPHYAHPDLSFVAVCMIRQFTPKQEYQTTSGVSENSEVRSSHCIPSAQRTKHILTGGRKEILLIQHAYAESMTG